MSNEKMLTRVVMAFIAIEVCALVSPRLLGQVAVLGLLGALGGAAWLGLRKLWRALK